jgi:hypothetical protein
VLPPDEFKSILLSSLSLALSQTVKRKMTPFRGSHHIRSVMKTVFVKLKKEGRLDAPWLLQPPTPAVLADMVNTRVVAGELEADVERVMEEVYPLEFAHRFPASSKKTSKPVIPPTAGGRFVDVSE